MQLGRKRIIDYERLRWSRNAEQWPQPDEWNGDASNRLYYSLFYRAVETLVYYHRGRKKTFDKEPILSSARADYEWLFNEGDSLITFSTVCNVLEIDEDEVIYWLKACGL